MNLSGKPSFIQFTLNDFKAKITVKSIYSSNRTEMELVSLNFQNYHKS